MKWFGEFLIDLGLRDETPGARIVGMHAFRSTLLDRAQNLMVVNAEAITGHSQNVTSLNAVQDGQVGGTTSAVVKKYQGELGLKVKQGILEHITWEDVRFIHPCKPLTPIVKPRR